MADNDQPYIVICTCTYVRCVYLCLYECISLPLHPFLLSLLPSSGVDDFCTEIVDRHRERCPDGLVSR